MKELKNCDCIIKQRINSIDLNEYCLTGSYTCDRESVARTILHSPISGTFNLKVEKLQESGESVQILIEGCSGDIYYRVISEEITKWKKVVTENILIEIVEQIKKDLDEKASKEELIHLEHSIQEHLNEKADINYVSEIEKKLYVLLSQKATLDNLSDLEAKLFSLLDKKADTDSIAELEELMYDELKKKADTESLNVLESEIYRILNEKLSGLINDIDYLTLNKADLQTVNDLEIKIYNELKNKSDMANLNKLEVQMAEKASTKQLEEVKQSIESIKKSLTQYYRLTGGVDIGKNADLNNYYEVGNYFCPLDVTAQTVLNKPSTLVHAFTLKVVHGTGHAYPSQIIQQLYNGDTYYRTYSSQNQVVKWWDWHKISS